MTSTSNARYAKLPGDPKPNPNGYYPNANSNYNHRSKNPNINCEDNSVAVFYISLAVFFTFFIGLSITFFAWILYVPNLPEFSVSRFDVSDFSLSSNSLTSGFSVSIAVGNPTEKWSIAYDNVHAAVLFSTGYAGDSVLYKNDFVIAETPMFPFSQRPRNVTDLKARLGTVGFYADEGRIRWGDGDLRFGVRLSSTARFKAGFWTTPGYTLKVYCDDVRVGLKNSMAADGAGSMVGPARGCQIWSQPHH